MISTRSFTRNVSIRDQLKPTRVIRRIFHNCIPLCSKHTILRKIDDEIKKQLWTVIVDICNAERQKGENYPVLLFY